jgi:putative CRISPR-associated protein (TIGR02619 family)
VMRTILTTVGTSLLGNAGRGPGTNDLSDGDLANYLARTDPVRASAETNSLSRLLHEGDRVVFLHSHTDKGRRCAEALRRHYDRQGYRAELVEISDLGYAESRFRLRGLRALVAALAERIEREQRHGAEVAINATGGFKAQIAYATLVGLLFDVPVYYIHEEFNELIEMPAVPIGWDYSVLAAWEEFFHVRPRRSTGDGPPCPTRFGCCSRTTTVTRICRLLVRPSCVPMSMPWRGRPRCRYIYRGRHRRRMSMPRRACGPCGTAR